MFWKKKGAPQIDSNDLRKGSGISESKADATPFFAIPEGEFEAWVHSCDHQIIHDLLVRASLRLLPSLFSKIVVVKDESKFILSVDESISTHISQVRR